MSNLTLAEVCFNLLLFTLLCFLFILKINITNGTYLSLLSYT